MIATIDEPLNSDRRDDPNIFYHYNCFVTLFEEQAENKPFELALVYKEERIDYHSLNNKANQVAHFLRSKGVKQEVLVPLCVENSAQMIVWILGILKAGGAYVPIDPNSPVSRIEYFLEDLGASLLISTKTVQSKLQVKSDVEIIEIDENHAEIENRCEENLPIVITPNTLAYVIYTSGSTGKPKGVMIEHHSLLNYLLYCKANYLSNKAVRSGSFMHLSYTFDASLTSMFLPLITGKSIIIGSKGYLETFEDSNFWKYAPYDFIKATPAHLGLLAETLNDTNNEWVTSKLIIGGEALHLNHLKPFIDRGVDIEVINEYGPTEATVGCSTYSFNTTYTLEKVEKKVSIGKPIKNVDWYIVNELGEIVEAEEPGEICISGAGLARGYLNRPELTAEKFIEKYLSNTWVRLYKTGDIGRWLPDGNMEYLGRMDNQVKIRGYRIELDEIENVLLQNEHIKQAAVIVKKDEQGNSKLLAYVIANYSAINQQNIFRYLQGRLPQFMIPSDVVLLSSFPLTKNGKVDKLALGKMEEKETRPKNDFKKPSTETEKRLAEIWMELLGINKVNICDNFFEIGGSSLQAVKMVSKIRNVFGVKLSLSLFHHAQTIEKIAAVVVNTADEKQFSCLVPIQPAGSKPPIFCVHGGWGHVLFYQGLADELGLDQPLYGLQVRGLNGIDKPFDKLEDMAAHYLQEIRRVQPNGPYQLAGYCYGAIVAFEMANQLTQNNEEVALLVNFNGPSPSYVLNRMNENNINQIKNPGNQQTNIAEKNEAVENKFLLEMKRFARLDVKQKLLYPLKLVNKMYWSSTIRITLANAKYKAACKYYLSLKKVMPDLLLKRYIMEAMSKAQLQYRAKAYEGKMIIFRSPSLYKDVYLGWSNLVSGGITSFDVPGKYANGNTIFQKPYVEVVAEELKRHLDKHDHLINVARSKSTT